MKLNLLFSANVRSDFIPIHLSLNQILKGKRKGEDAEQHI